MTPQAPAPVLPTLYTAPARLFASRLPAGQAEFSCFLRWDAPLPLPLSLTWSLTPAGIRQPAASGCHALTPAENDLGRLPLAAFLPAGWEGGRLRLTLRSPAGRWHCTFPVAAFRHETVLSFPLAGQVLVLTGHRLGEPHRSTWLLPCQHFAWDLLPLGPRLELLRNDLSESLRAADFYGFGQPVCAPAAGRVAQAVDGLPDLLQAGELPDREAFLADLRLALGNHVVLDHGDSVFSLLAHLQQGSVRVRHGQDVPAGVPLAALGNSGHSSGPHLHLHFMDGPDFLTASPLPVALSLEGGVYAPLAGEITAAAEQVSPPP